MKYLILGVDPGITTAIAALDFDGNIVALYSRKKLGFKKLLEVIVKIGLPVIIACDVEVAPELVRKLASQFKAKIVLPERNLKVGEKQRMVEEYAKERNMYLQLPNDHERDALASAIFAFKKYRALFNKVDEYLKKIGKEELRDTVKKKLLLGEVSSLKEAVETKHEEISAKEIFVMQEEKYKQLKKKIKELKEALRKLKEEKEELKKKLKAATAPVIYDEKLKRLADKRLDTINALRTEVGKLKREIRTLVKKFEVKRKGYLIVEEIDGFDAEAAKNVVCDLVKVKGKLSKQVEKVLKDRGIKIYDGEVEVIDGIKVAKEKEDVYRKIINIIEEYRSR